jgi:hypothetical protein
MNSRVSSSCPPLLDPPLENVEITCSDYVLVAYDKIHRHSNSGPPFSSFGSSRDYGMNLGSISLNHLSIFYNISCYNSLVLLSFVSRSNCRITCKIWINGDIPGKIEHPIVTRKGGRKLFVSDDVKEFHEA